VRKQNLTQRFARLENVLRTLLLRPTLTLAEVKASLAGEHPAYITRLVHELERAGHLQRESAQVFRWVLNPQDFSAKTWLEKKLYAPRLPQTPAGDRPRERLLANGAAALRTAELLAILIRAGLPGESALQAGEKLVARFADQLDRLAEAGPGELKTLAAAVGETAYCQIMAGIELGRRVVESRGGRQQTTRRVLGSEEAREVCRGHFARLAADATQEEFHIVCLSV
jgi:DNA repair protein RadC